MGNCIHSLCSFSARVCVCEALSDFFILVHGNTKKTMSGGQQCDEWQWTGGCRYANRCKFRHDGRGDPVAMSMCYDFASQLACNFGDDCKHLHSIAAFDRLTVSKRDATGGGGGGGGGGSSEPKESKERR